MENFDIRNSFESIFRFSQGVFQIVSRGASFVIQFLGRSFRDFANDIPWLPDTFKNWIASFLPDTTVFEVMLGASLGFFLIFTFAKWLGDIIT